MGVASAVVTSSLKPVVASNSKFNGYLKPGLYTVCLGAGVSRGIAPDWKDLAYNLMSQAFSTHVPSSTFDELMGLGWSLDALIQAAANEFKRRGKTNADISEAIEQCLYAKIRDKARGLGLESYLTAVLNRPKSMPKDRVIEVCDFLEHSFPNCTLFPVARFLIDSAKRQRGPRAVLSFNADTFLETYIDLYLRREHYKSPPPHGHPTYYFVSVHGSGGGSEDKTPIYHCHGSIAPSETAGRRPRDRRDRLIFLEEEYLAVSGGRSAWAQTVFLYHAQNTTMAFYGLSMSDTNIRRWMSTMEADERAYHHAQGNSDRTNPKHIWLRPKPSEPLTQDIILSSLTHLGVRPGWIDNWGDIDKALLSLTATKAA